VQSPASAGLSFLFEPMSRRPSAASSTVPLNADTPACLREVSTGTCVLALQVQPNARRTEVLGEQGGALRLKLASPPVDGQANEALIAWLAKELGVAKRCLRLRRGAAARHKQVEIDLDAGAVRVWLARQPRGG
jgi:uncharacterized protein (TIGR00251 family)